MRTPERYINAKYEDVPENIRTLVKAMRESKRGIYIHGGVGSGKTHVAYAIANKWNDVTRGNVIFWNTTELMQEIKDDYDRDAYSKKHTLDNLMHTEQLIVLDDIGVEKVSDWVLERFYLLINKRYNEMRPIIFTSNYTPADLADKIGERTVSRIVELCEVVKLDGADRRLQR